MQKILVVDGPYRPSFATELTLDDMPEHIQIALVDLTKAFPDPELVTREEVLAKLDEPQFMELRDYLPLWQDMRLMMEPREIRHQPIDLRLHEERLTVRDLPEAVEKPWERDRGDNIRSLQAKGTRVASPKRISVARRR